MLGYHLFRERGSIVNKSVFADCNQLLIDIFNIELNVAENQ
jgi:hypothetical protein